MQSFLKASAVLLALFVCISSSYAQGAEATPVRGKVVKSGKNPGGSISVMLVSKDGKVMDTKSPDPQGRCVFDVTNYPEGAYTVQFKESASAAACSGPTVTCRGVGSPKSAGFKNGAAARATGGDTCGNYTCTVSCDTVTCNILNVTVMPDSTRSAQPRR